MAAPLLLDGLHPPLLVYASGPRISVVSLGSGALLHTYSVHEDQVVVLLGDPADPGAVVSCSSDGCVSRWDARTAREARRTLLHMKLFDLVVCATRPSQLCVVTEDAARPQTEGEDGQGRTGERYQLLLLEEGLGEARVLRPLMTLRRPRGCVCTLVVAGEEWVVGASGSALTLLRLEGGLSSQRVRFRAQRGAINLLAAAPGRDLLATAHSKGQIALWHEVGAWLSALPPEGSARAKDRPLSTLLHWHALHVRCLCFHADGAQLFSGGEEGVLVQWRLAGGKTFLPRVGGQIARVSCGANGLLALATTDNCLRVVDTAM